MPFFPACWRYNQLNLVSAVEEGKFIYNVYNLKNGHLNLCYMKRQMKCDNKEQTVPRTAANNRSVA